MKTVFYNKKTANKLVKNGLMREDFYNRIMGKIIHIKPLRERPDDLSNLIDHFFDKASRTVFLSDDAKNELLKYDWRGNIRELKRVIINLTDKDDGIVNLVDIKKIFELIKLDEDDTFGNSQEIHKDSLLTHKIIDEARNLTYQGMLKRLQSEFYDLALYQSNGKAVTIQKTFGIARGSIYNHMKSKDINMEVLQ